MSVVPASVLAHNASLLNDLEEGDLVEFPRGAYSHWATYIGIMILSNYCKYQCFQ